MSLQKKNPQTLKTMHLLILLKNFGIMSNKFKMHMIMHIITIIIITIITVIHLYTYMSYYFESERRSKQKIIIFFLCNTEPNYICKQLLCFMYL